MCPTLDCFIKEIDRECPKLVIVDSLQVIMKEDYRGVSADVSVFQIIQKLRDWTEKNDAILIIIGHVTKEGEFEGKNTIKQMIETQQNTYNWQFMFLGANIDAIGDTNLKSFVVAYSLSYFHYLTSNRLDLWKIYEMQKVEMSIQEEIKKKIKSKKVVDPLTTK
jgi:RecA-family ATPase